MNEVIGELLPLALDARRRRNTLASLRFNRTFASLEFGGARLESVWRRDQRAASLHTYGHEGEPMAEFEYGPVDIYLVGFPGEMLDDNTLASLGALMVSDAVRLLDLLIVSRGENGELTIREFEEFRDEYGLTVVELEASGIIGDEDVDELGGAIAPGTSGAILALELVFAKQLASNFAAAGGEVLQVERIPAQVVNEVLAAASDEE